MMMCREQAARTPEPGLREQNDVVIFSQPWEREHSLSVLAEYVSALTLTASNEQAVALHGCHCGGCTNVCMNG